MSTTPGRKQLSHDRIVETAARAIRRGGFQGVGVADIMKEAGLTHGGFYAHFASRDALLVEALECAQAQSTGADRPRSAAAFREVVESYLSESHLKEVECGCPVAALVSEMPRQSPEVRKASARSVRRMVGAVRAAMPPDTEAGTAEIVASQMIGALQLARALGPHAEGKRLLATVGGGRGAP
jgi:TetR/AcrR family transcriptional repressor of nem operon